MKRSDYGPVFLLDFNLSDETHNKYKIGSCFLNYIYVRVFLLYLHLTLFNIISIIIVNCVTRITTLGSIYSLIYVGCIMHNNSKYYNYTAPVRSRFRMRNIRTEISYLKRLKCELMFIVIFGDWEKQQFGPN